MKKIYFQKQHSKSGKRKGILAGLFFHILCFVFPLALSSQTINYTFTPCGATGRYGPSQGQVNTAYSSTNLNGSVTVIANGIQTWTVPTSGAYRIAAYGAQGGTESPTKYGGRGAAMIGDFTFTAGQVLKILVGQQGSSVLTYYGGGGGSFVATITNSPLCVAGGGGGAGGTAGGNGVDAVTTTSGTAGVSGGTGGVNGNGGLVVSTNGGSGGGFYTDGTGAFSSSQCSVNAGLAFVNGGDGGQYTTWLPGGFGGGGGGWNGTGNGGGGGGYSGGGTSGSSYTGGGGGGSYNGGTNQNNSAGTYTGEGRVIITSLCNITLTSPINPICSGNTTTLNTNAVSNYSWSNGSTSSSLVVTPTVTTNYTVTGTSTANCMTSAVITVTVSSGLPVLSITSSTNSLCLGKTVTLTASGALTYTWSNGVTNGISYGPTTTNAYTVTGENGCGTTTAITTITVAPLAISAITTPTLICASSPATMTSVGPATLFIWVPFQAILSGSTVVVNPSVTTLYTVTASDGTCAGTATVLLTVDPNPTISVVANVSVVCEGYPVNMTASGGLSYTWMPGNMSGPSVTVNPTAPILYTVVGSNSFGCLAGAPQILLTNPSPTITISANNTFVCPGTAVNIIAGGGNTYVWSNGPTTPGIAVNPTVTTSYNVVGTGQTGTCTATKIITIVVFDPAFTITGTPTICSGSSATLIASGADSYLWDNGANVNLIVVSPTLNTIYTVGATTTSNNITCTATNTIQVAVSPKPIITAASSRTLICKSESSILTAGGAISYTWNTAATSATITVTPTVPVLYTYSVTGTNANGCTNIATTQVKVNACNGINETAMKGVQLLAYPNPNKGEFMIESDSEITLNMVNELGQVVKTINLTGSNNFKASVSDLANGIYFVTGQNNSGKVNQKIVVNK